MTLKSETWCASLAVNGSLLLPSERTSKTCTPAWPCHTLGITSCSEHGLCTLDADELVTNHNCSGRLMPVFASLPFPSFLCFSAAAEYGRDSFSRVVNAVCHFDLISCEDITETLLEQF